MNRQKLLALLSTIVILAAAACTDVTAPKRDGPAPCPVSGGPDTCKPQ